ncbi:MAG: serine hydroxymethyltransferase, partial [Reyranellaceae bacterium]
IGITVNKQVVPDDRLPPLRPSGIRLGTPACTTRGMDEGAMRRVAGWIVQTLRAPQDEALLTRLASEVKELARLYPIPALSS